MATHMESSQHRDKGWTRAVCDSMPFIYLIVASLLVGVTYHNVVISNPWRLVAFLAFTAFTLVGFSVLAHWLNCCGDSSDYRLSEKNGEGKHDHPSHSHHSENLNYAYHHHSHDGTERCGTTPGPEGSLHHTLTDRFGKGTLEAKGKHFSWRKLKKMIDEKWSDLKDWAPRIGHRDSWSEAEVRNGQESWEAGPIFDPDHCADEILITAIICAAGTVAGNTVSFECLFTTIRLIR